MKSSCEWLTLPGPAFLWDLTPSEKRDFNSLMLAFKRLKPYFKNMKHWIYSRWRKNRPASDALFAADRLPSDDGFIEGDYQFDKISSILDQVMRVPVDTQVLGYEQGGGLVFGKVVKSCFEFSNA